MKLNILKYFLLVAGLISLIIIYLSVVGLETDKFNDQIKKKIFQTNNELELKLKKIKLKLDPFNLKINAQTVNTEIIYKKRNIELEYIKTQISLNSLIKNTFVSSNLEISTKTILLKDLVSFLRVTSNKPQLFILESIIKNGNVILNIKLDFDENGKIKKDYEINGFLKNGKINLLKDNNFDKIDFIFNVKDNIYDFKNINFTIDKINFFSENLKVIKNKNDFIFEGVVENKKTNLENKLLNLVKASFKNLNFEAISFSSKNNFSFKINNKFKLKDLLINSIIEIDQSKYIKPKILNNIFTDVEDVIILKDHIINITYNKDNLSLKGSGKVKLENEFDKINYVIINKKSDFEFISNINLSELSIINNKFTKNFFPNTNDKINLKNHKIKISYKNNSLSFEGLGKIQIEKKLDQINYFIKKNENNLEFDVNLDLNKTLLKIDTLNYEKQSKSKASLKLIGSYNKYNELNLNEVSILEKNNKFLLNNISLDKEYKILSIDSLNLDYIDNKNKKNQLTLNRKQKNNYELLGEEFNANSLITGLLENKEDEQSKVFKNEINLNLKLNKVYIDDDNIIKNLNGNLYIKDNKVFNTNISAIFANNENLTFAINTNNGKKITTLFSSRAEPIVNRYKFIKGYRGGYLDFYSEKVNNISNSKLNIYNFKLKKLPALTKLLTLASLQGIADLLSGEGIGFNEFEMNFNNKGDLMTIDEIYAIGPAISILMNGYVEQDKLISLRGTLVPATTINKTIGSIPFLGKILVGEKTGEGVFGVSFKIKGPPKKLETTVNPIKTLTPRFITRTLEKIKKN